MRLLVPLCILVACSDYNLESSKDEAGRRDTDTGGGPAVDTGEVGDGDTDEDGECDAPDLGPDVVPVDASCTAPPVGTFTPIVEWH